MSDAGLMQGVADEGGFWPTFNSKEQALDFLVRSIEFLFQGIFRVFFTVLFFFSRTSVFILPFGKIIFDSRRISKSL